MRYSKDHKQQTHEKLVQAASRKFREYGFDGVAITDLMNDSQLTHGGFYRHFSGKEQLYTEALAFSIADVQARLLDQLADGDQPTLKEIIQVYLSLDHCEGVAGGCPVAALSAEIARQSPIVQQSFDTALRAYMQRFLPLMPGTSQAEQQEKFLVLFSGMAGVLTVARAVSDPTWRASILASARTFYINTFCE